MPFYIIPTRAAYEKKRVDKGKAWDQVYGRVKCSVCGKHFAEGDIYVQVGDGVYRHLDCNKPRGND